MNDISKAFTKIFWGFMLVFLDFKINQFDLLPDFVGYFIIVSALSDLNSFSAYFKKARTFAIILAILSIPEYFIGEINILEGIVPSTSTILILISSSVLTLIHIAFIFFLLQGCIELANHHQNSTLAKTTKNIQTFYIIILLAVTILTPFVLNIPQDLATAIIIVGGIASFVVYIIVLILIWSYRKAFNSISK
ncbi:hypothetical protein ACFFF5_18180 [Lederbergia wuyishanensis]|uniref:Uncharacterized protein n=1 Tax=Lederbergia wuyishanensis TaxID=1347903 RepID=A0ABU0D4N1_9BACI|nr:hypothetical protein [Lederbergia wuyishanensis]MCJ8008044.1 hypothetical protein [Lederbergia wuyishanensis]MDQ0343371.1 hypothetical protein [Lederbergia wuyishanensis]